MSCLAATWVGNAALADICQDPRDPSGDWRFGASDSLRGWTRCDWVELGEAIHSIEVTGVVLAHPPGAWMTCPHDTLDLELNLWADGGGRPGTQLMRERFQLVGVVGDSLYGGLARAVRLELPVDPQLDLRAGWVDVRSLGTGDCLWLWSAADGGDGMSALDRGAGWEVAPFDLALCARGLRLAAPRVKLRRQGDSLLLSWKQVDGAQRYQVWMDAADGLGFQPAGEPGSQTVWIHPLDSLATLSTFRVTSLSP
jgi:hypothetical protein